MFFVEEKGNKFQVKGAFKQMQTLMLVNCQMLQLMFFIEFLGKISKNLCFYKFDCFR